MSAATMNNDPRLSNIYAIFVEKPLPEYGKVEIVLNGDHVDVITTERKRLKLVKK